MAPLRITVFMTLITLNLLETEPHTTKAILITGGWDNPGTTEVYFPGANKGCKVPKYALPAVVHSTTMDTFGNKTLICGGGEIQNYCLEFTPNSEFASSTVWTKFTDLQMNRWEHTSWVSSSGVVLIGGYAPFAANAETSAELVTGGVLPFTLPATR